MKQRNYSAAAVVLGGYVNAYGLVRSLHEAGVPQIILIDNNRSAASYSRLLSEVAVIESWDDLVPTLQQLSTRIGRLVLYPTSDVHVELIANRHTVLESSCFLPMNVENVLQAGEKSIQYAAARKAGVSVPETEVVTSLDDMAKLYDLEFPLLLKPSRRIDGQGIGFRNRILNSREDLLEAFPSIEEVIGAGVEILASEIIPGGNNVYAYTAYRNPEGKTLRSWTGRKLSQHPDDFGVYASATTVLDQQLARDGHAVLEALDCHGICEPEFKLDPRDGRFKLMEVNLRSMMWHRTGALAGVNLPEAQWLDALGLPVPVQAQREARVVHSYWAHELANLLSRPGYAAQFRANLKGGKREWAFWNVRDPLPFLASLKHLPRLVVTACQRRFAPK